MLRFPHRTPSLVGAGRGLGKVKEEVTANGRRRGTFAQTPACPGGALQFAANPDEEALFNADARQKKDPAEGGICRVRIAWGEGPTQ